MVSSRWRHTWHNDFERVLVSMTSLERAVLHRSGLDGVEGRRAFVDASSRLALDITYCAYIMEQASLGLDSLPVSQCFTCGGRIYGATSPVLTSPWARPFEAGDLRFCSEACLLRSAQQLMAVGYRRQASLQATIQRRTA